MKSIKEDLSIDKWKILKKNAIKLDYDNLKNYDLIFADPPYMLNDLKGFVYGVESVIRQKPDTLFILEHIKTRVFDSDFLNFTKTYGETSLSFYNLAV